MNRRQFVRATSLIAATGATCMVSPIARAGGYQENLLSAPDLCIGRQFLLDDGTLVTPERVEATTRDSRWQQWELHFSAESELVEGTFGLASQSGAAAVLYMQGFGNKARASVSRVA